MGDVSYPKTPEYDNMRRLGVRRSELDRQEDVDVNGRTVCCANRLAPPSMKIARGVIYFGFCARFFFPSFFISFSSKSFYSVKYVYISLRL